MTPTPTTLAQTHPTDASVHEVDLRGCEHRTPLTRCHGIIQYGIAFWSVRYDSRRCGCLCTSLNLVTIIAVDLGRSSCSKNSTKRWKWIQSQHNDVQDGRPQILSILRLHLTDLLDLVIEDHVTAVHCVSTTLHRLGIESFIEC